MFETRGSVAALAIVLLVSLGGAAGPAPAAEVGPFAFKAPAPGTLLVYSDGFQIAFGATSGRVTKALAGPKSAPRGARIEIEDGFLMRRIERGRRLVTSANSIEKPGFWPLTPGATQRFRMEVAVDGTTRQRRRGVARIAKAVTALSLAGKTRRVLKVETDIRWPARDGGERRVTITYFHDLDLGYYVKRIYTRYGPEGRPRTPTVRELARVGRASGAPKR